MLTQKPAPSGRADGCNDRRVWLAGIPFAEAEKISLLFQILGWSVAVEQGVPVGEAVQPWVTQPCLTQPKLRMRASGNIIDVATDDPAVAPILAAAGLDRLVMPVALPTLEQLMVFAG